MRDVDQVVDAPVHIVHRGQISRVTGYGRATLRGALPYRLTAGRVPDADGEIALGPRLADEFGVHVGDHVVLSDLAGHRSAMRVTGIVVMPTLEKRTVGSQRVDAAWTPCGGPRSRRATRICWYARSIRGSTRRCGANSPARSRSNCRRAEHDRRARQVGRVAAAADHRVADRRHVARRGARLVAGASARRPDGDCGVDRDDPAPAHRRSTASATVLTAAVGVVIGAPLGWALSRVVLVEIGPRLGLGLAGPGIVISVLIALAGLLGRVARCGDTRAARASPAHHHGSAWVRRVRVAFRVMPRLLLVHHTRVTRDAGAARRGCRGHVRRGTRRCRGRRACRARRDCVGCACCRRFCARNAGEHRLSVRRDEALLRHRLLPDAHRENRCAVRVVRARQHRHRRCGARGGIDHEGDGLGAVHEPVIVSEAPSKDDREAVWELAATVCAALLG